VLIAELSDDLHELEYYNPLFFGRLTQLVECHPYKVEVTGSSPVSPTSDD
tara:strand:- start:2034 stop:2183 length:150 start_codon:yes stop_codon:yes gene_type:complete